MWSLGCVLEMEDRLKMQEFVLSYKNRLLWPHVLSETTTIFEYFVTEEGNWQVWNSVVPTYEYPEESIPDFNRILVPNVDNVRTIFLIDITAKQNKPLLLIGKVEGTMRSACINGSLL